MEPRELLQIHLTSFVPSSATIRAILNIKTPFVYIALAIYFHYSANSAVIECWRNTGSLFSIHVIFPDNK